MREFQSYENYFAYFQMRLSLLANVSSSRISYFTMSCANIYLIGAKVWDCYQRLLGNLGAPWKNCGHSSYTG